MKISLSREAMEALPEADSQGIIRTNAALKMTADGKAELMEINDSPVGKADAESAKTDDDNPMPDADLNALAKAPMY